MIKSLFRLPLAFSEKRLVSIDIGGTLAKAAFYVPDGEINRSIPKNDQITFKSGSNKIYFKTFESKEKGI